MRRTPAGRAWDEAHKRTGLPRLRVTKPTEPPEPPDWSNETCTYCGKLGHWRPDCPEIRKEMGKR